MKYYAVIDTNVLVSAMLRWNSVPGNVIRASFEGDLVPVLNVEIVREYREVLMRPKFHLTEQIVEERKSEDAYLVTGNIKHFPVTSFIVTPRQMLDIIYGEK